MATFYKLRLSLSLFLLTVLFVGITSQPVTSTYAETSIELEEFRWNTFPLKVLVDMNEWSIPDYATAVHRALEHWIKSIWNYTHSFTDTTLMISYLFYVSSINYTDNYDIFVSFTPNELSSNSKIVGLTTYKWNMATNSPIRPIIINITTYSATADHLFIKNIAMHEFGHALGLGHASSASTSNGPELMHYLSYNDQVVYPSTLDVYGLTMLYKGYFGQIVQLPFDIPYKMLSEGNIPPYIIPSSPFYFLYPSISEFEYILAKPLEILYRPWILLIPSIIWLMISLVFTVIMQSGKKGTLIAIALSVVIAYYVLTWNINLVSLGLKIVLLFPAIMVGASIGELLIRLFVIKPPT